MITLIADHLWGSTLVALALAASTLAFRNNGAHVRYWLWFAASVKFLIPFAALVFLGGVLKPHDIALVAPAPITEMVSAISLPASVDSVVAQRVAVDWSAAFAGIWASGLVAVLILWTRKWLDVRKALREATPVDICAPIPVRTTTATLEPGLIGIFWPVLLIPEGLTQHLSNREFSAVLAHELCHLRRRDNLTAAIQMFIQAIFWFHPLVWWFGTRLMAERERACDEAATAANSPEVYAESILKVCRLYARSPLICAAGVSGANLKQRIEAIIMNRPVSSIGRAKSLLLAMAAAALVIGPVGFGWSSATGRAPTTLNATASLPAQFDVPEVRLRVEGAPPVTLVVQAALVLNCADAACTAERSAMAASAARVAEAVRAEFERLTLDDVKDTARLLARKGDVLLRAKETSGAPAVVKDLVFKNLWVASREYSAAYSDTAWNASVTSVNHDPDGLRLTQAGSNTIRSGGIEALTAKATITNSSSAQRGFPAVNFQLINARNQVIQQAVGLPVFCCLEPGKSMDIQLAVRKPAEEPLKMVAVWATYEDKAAPVYDASKEQVNTLRILDNGVELSVRPGKSFLAVKGYVFNMNTIVMKLPLLKLEVYDGNHQVVGSVIAPASASTLQPGTAAPYDIQMELPPQMDLRPSLMERGEQMKGRYAVSFEK